MRIGACRWIVAAALGTGIAATSATAAAGATTWKATVSGPPRTSSQPFEWLAKELEAKTGGQMKIEIAYNRGQPTDMADWIKSGVSDAAWMCSSYYADKMPLMTVLDLPLLAPDNISVLSRVELALADHPAIQAELRKWNIKLLLPAPLPQYQLMGTRRIAKVEDFRGAKVRAGGEMGKILQEYGATISFLSSVESVAALKSGAVDVVASSYPMAFASYKVQDVSKYVTDKISLGAQLCYFGVSQRAWDALPAKVQALTLGLRQPAMAKYEEIYAREDAPNIAAFQQKGLEFVAFGTADRARLVAKAIKYWQIWIQEREKQGLKGREVFEFVQAKIREYERK
jgi:TRAP-type C4-dicarboxylate transport system substrate-binding protein